MQGLISQPLPVRLLNAALFQVGWFVCVLGGNRVASAMLLVLLPIHCYFFGTRKECYFIVLVATVGILIDSILTSLNVLIFPELSIGIPIWLACLWAMFATTLCHSLIWLQDRLLLAGLLAACFGPFSYFVGSQMTTVDLGQPLWRSLAIMAMTWACFFTLAMYGSRYVTPKS